MLYAADGSVSEDLLISRLRRVSPTDIQDEALTDFKIQKGMALNRITAIKIAERADRGCRKDLIMPALMTKKVSLSRSVTDNSVRRNRNK